MSDQHNTPTPLDAALAVQIRAARMRGAYSIEALATLADVEPGVVTGLENGARLTDVDARDRVMDVLGLRPDSHRYPGSLTAPRPHTRD